MEHPHFKKKWQHIVADRTWHIPVVKGPVVPSKAKEPEQRAKLLLLLFKPWQMEDSAADGETEHMIPCLMTPPPGTSGPPHENWVDAWEQWHAYLLTVKDKYDKEDDPPKHSHLYYHRFIVIKTLQIVDNLDQMATRKAPESALDPNKKWKVDVEGELCTEYRNEDQELYESTEAPEDAPAEPDDALPTPKRKPKERTAHGLRLVREGVAALGECRAETKTGKHRDFAATFFNQRQAHHQSPMFPTHQKDHDEFVPQLMEPTVQIAFQDQRRYFKVRQKPADPADVHPPQARPGDHPTDSATPIITDSPSTTTQLWDNACNVIETAFHPQGSPNRKQIAAFLLVAKWTQTHIGHQLGETMEPPQQLIMAMLGAGGTGKTYTLNHMKRFVHTWLGDGTVVQAAFMNSAARLVGGETLHSLFDIPRELSESSRIEFSGKKRTNLVNN